MSPGLKGFDSDKPLGSIDQQCQNFFVPKLRMQSTFDASPSSGMQLNPLRHTVFFITIRNT